MIVFMLIVLLLLIQTCQLLSFILQSLPPSALFSSKYKTSKLYTNNNANNANKPNDKYSDEEMMLKVPIFKGKGYQVILPKSMDLPILSDAEREKILEKEYQIKNEGKTELDILKEQIKKMLDDM